MDTTEALRAGFPGLLRDLEIGSLLDLPCGDWNWMQHVDLTDVDYVGGDVVEPLVAELRARFAKRPRTHFLVLDIVSDDLPTCDAVFVRDLFNHLDNQQVADSIANIRRSGAAWLLTTYYPELKANGDIEMGESRPINYTREPWSWPSPARQMAERPVTNGQFDRLDKTVAAWRIADIPRYNGRGRY